MSIVIFTSTATNSFQAHKMSSGGAGKLLDVVVVGGGLVGRALAAAMAREARCKGMQAALVVGKVPPMPTATPSQRVVALSPASEAWIRRTGAWKKMGVEQRPAFQSMRVADACKPGAQVQLDAKGCVIEVDMITKALQEAAKDAQGGAKVDWIWKDEVRSVQLPKNGGVENAGDAMATVHLDSGERLRARLVVAADGANSRVREMCGLTLRSYSHGQRAVCCVVNAQGVHHSTWQRFLPSGPIAVLPMRDGYSCIVWSIGEEEASNLEASTDEEVLARVNEALHTEKFYEPPSQFLRLLGKQWRGKRPKEGGEVHSKTNQGEKDDSIKSNCESAGSGVNGSPEEDSNFTHENEKRGAFPWATSLVSRPKSFPLKVGQSTRYTLPRLALAGDAAHVMHPLAGQGVNMGFGDVELLLDLMVKAGEGGEDIGGQRLLQEYAHRRRAANIAMTATVEGLKALFAANGNVMATARLFGMSALDSMPFLKEQMVRFASRSAKW